MKRKLIAPLLFLLAACQQETPAPTATTATQPVPAAAAAGRDPHSYSRPDEVKVEHIALDLAVDFA
jgi:hypothetical protein